MFFLSLIIFFFAFIMWHFNLIILLYVLIIVMFFAFITGLMRDICASVRRAIRAVSHNHAVGLRLSYLC